MKYVVIMNGKPESGKTTFENHCIKYLNDNEIACGYMVSSIDPIKDMYALLGWNGEKTDKARKDLSILKKMWISNNDGPTRYVVDFIMQLPDDEDNVVFVDIREAEEIMKLIGVLEPLSVIGVKYTTVFVERIDNSGIEYGNESDDDVVLNKLYNKTICNDGTIEQLNHMAEIFIDHITEWRK